MCTHEPRLQHRLISDLNYRIATNLQRYKIQIPFPQRDLHLRSPQIEQVLSALSRHHFTEAELTAPQGQDATTEVPEVSTHAPDWLEDELGPRSWSDEQITTIVARMRSSGGLAVGDRRHLLTVYRECFVGREAVDWMTRALGLTRKEAVEFGQLLMDRGLVRHVLDEHGFRDGSFFYTFRKREPERADERAALSA